MHELSIATAMIAQIEEVRIKEGSDKVTAVILKIGDLAGVENDALEMAFPFACENTAAAGAELIIERVPLSVSCSDCGKVSEPEMPYVACVDCGSSNVEITSGRDLTIKTIRME